MSDCNMSLNSGFRKPAISGQKSEKGSLGKILSELRFLKGQKVPAMLRAERSLWRPETVAE